jgi:hypothetical protein
MNISRRKLVASSHGTSPSKPATTKVGTGSKVSKKTKAANRREKRPSSSSTPSTAKREVEDVEAVEGLPRRKKPKKPEYHWQMEAGLDRNFVGVGELLKSLKMPLYEHAEGGLIFVEGGRPHRITSAKELAPFLIDRIRIAVTKNGKYHGTVGGGRWKSVEGRWLITALITLGEPSGSPSVWFPRYTSGRFAFVAGTNWVAAGR